MTNVIAVRQLMVSEMLSEICSGLVFHRRVKCNHSQRWRNYLFRWCGIHPYYCDFVLILYGASPLV